MPSTTMLGTAPDALVPRGCKGEAMSDYHQRAMATHTTNTSTNRYIG